MSPLRGFASCDSVPVACATGLNYFAPAGAYTTQRLRAKAWQFGDKSCRHAVGRRSTRPLPPCVAGEEEFFG